MRTKKIILFLTLCVLIGVSSSPMSTLAFSQNPQLTDAPGDAPANYEDIKAIWLDNNATYLMFKMELAAPYNGTLSGQVKYIAISVNDSTGQVTGFFDIWKCDFIFGVSANGTGLNIVIFDYANFSNDLALNNHLGYFIQTDNDMTIEIGYRLQTYQDGKGFLDVVPGQTIKVRFFSGSDGDVAPEDAELPLTYTLKMESGSEWLIILLIVVIPVCGVALGLFIMYRRRTNLEK
jgi:hypothetical protein